MCQIISTAIVARIKKDISYKEQKYLSSIIYIYIYDAFDIFFKYFVKKKYKLHDKKKF